MADSISCLAFEVEHLQTQLSEMENYSLQLIIESRSAEALWWFYRFVLLVSQSITLR